MSTKKDMYMYHIVSCLKITYQLLPTVHLLTGCPSLRCDTRAKTSSASRLHTQAHTHTQRARVLHYVMNPFSCGGTSCPPRPCSVLIERNPLYNFSFFPVSYPFLHEINQTLSQTTCLPHNALLIDPLFSELAPILS